MKRIFTFVCLFAILGLSNGFSLTITTGAVTTPLCAGTTISVPYTVSAQFNGANVFKAELSDSAGSFTIFTIIGVMADSVSGTITATIPANAVGTHYRVRVIGTSPSVIGANNGANINVVALPHPSILYTTPVNMCLGDSVMLNAGAWFSYLWSTGATTSTITVNAAGTYTVIVSTSNGCTGLDGQAITTYPLPTVSFSGLPATVCSNAGSIALTGSPTGPGGHFSGIGVTNSNFNPNNLSGVHSVTFTYTDSVHGCTNTSTQLVTVKAITNDVLSTSGPVNFCQGHSVNFTSLTYASYSWNTGETTVSITADTAGTYTVTVTATNGCTTTASRTVTIYPLPTVSFIGLTSPVCSNVGSMALTGSPVGGNFSGSGVTNSNFNPASLANGSYTITYAYIEPSHSCQNTSSQVVTVNQITPVLITPTGATSFCQGDNVTLNTGAYASYLWSNGATTSSITADTAGTFTVTATAANGCTTTASRTVTVYPLPTVSFIGLTSPVCSNVGSMALTGSPIGGNFSGSGVTNSNFNPLNLANGTYTVTYSYTESLHGCANTSSQSVVVNHINTVLITPTGATSFCLGDNVTLNTGAYASYHWNTSATTSGITVNAAGTYTVTATAANGCSGVDSQVITIFSLPVVTFSGLPPTVCSSAGNITLTGSPIGGVFYGGGITGTTFNPINLPSGNDTITYFYTDANGCSNTSVQHTVVSNTNVIITPSGATVFCQGGSVTLSVGVFLSYIWSNGATTNSITINTVGSNTYTVTVTTGSGCTGSTFQVVTVFATTPVSFSGLPASACSNAGNFPLTGSPLTGTFFGGGISGNNFNPMNLPSGNDTITYGYNNANGCYSSTYMVVNITNVNPIMQVTGSSAFCANTSATLTPGVYTTYLWSTGATTSSITVNTIGTTTYTVTVTGGSGCTGTATQDITVFPLPVVDFSGLPATVCSDAALIPLTGNPLGGAYSGTGVVAHNFNPHNLNGTYTVTYTYVEPIHGCSNTATHSITVNPFTNVVITPNSSTTFCVGDSVTLNTGLYSSYLWSNGATTSGITVNTSGTYTVTCTAANGCTGTASRTVTVNLLTTVDFTGLPATTCSDAGNIALTGSPSGGNFSGPGISGTNFNPQNIPTGTVSITYTFTNSNGCTSSASHSIGVSNVNATIFANSALNFCSGGSVTLRGDSSNTAFHWSNSATTQAINVTASGNYTVTVTGLYGCTRTNTDTVTVYALPTINFVVAPSTICSDAAPITLTATPAGGTFGGPGVTNNHFNPHNLSGAQVLTYTFLDTTHGCSNTGTSTITVNAFPTLAMTLSIGNSFCAGNSQIMTVGTTYASYIWSNGGTTNSISATTTGRYTVTATAANGCTGTISDSITVWANPVISFTGLPAAPVCNVFIDFHLTATPLGGHYFGAGMFDTTFNPNGMNSGVYAIIYYYTDGHGCTGYDTNWVTVHNCTGISEIQLNNGMEIFPNPNDGNFTLHYNLTQPNATLNILDLTGRLVSTFDIKGTAGNQNINTELSNGIYFWQLINTKGIAAKGKIAVSK